MNAGKQQQVLASNVVSQNVMQPEQLQLPMVALKKQLPLLLTSYSNYLIV